MIYDALNKDNSNNNSPLQMILNVLNPKKETPKPKKQQKVKIITSKEELNQVQKDPKLESQLVGVDVSKWNGNINWKEAKEAGVQFAIIRAGYGQTNVDFQFKRNIEGCIENNIYIGIYWFSYAYTDNMALQEAKKCIQVIEPYKEYIKMPVFFDFEYDSVAYATRNGVHITKARCTSITDTFCKFIVANGYGTGIYTNLDFSKNYYTRTILDTYNTWVADWSGSCSYNGRYLMWQYTENGRIKGIGKVDMNIYYGQNRK